jgi:hypothetical protein
MLEGGCDGVHCTVAVALDCGRSRGALLLTAILQWYCRLCQPRRFQSMLVIFCGWTILYSASSVTDVTRILVLVQRSLRFPNQHSLEPSRELTPSTSDSIMSWMGQYRNFGCDPRRTRM